MTRLSSVRRHASSRALLAAPCLLAFSGCHEVIPSIFVNDTDADVVIRYSMYRNEIEPGRLAMCRFDSDPPRVVSKIVSARDWTGAGWGRGMEGRYNHDTCEAEQVVKASTSVWIETNGACSDYEKHLKRNPAFPPTLDPFVVTSPAGNIELHGWDVARAFENRSGGACIFSAARALGMAKHNAASR